MYFDKLDLDGNGKWTYQEAQDLEQQYARDMKRYLDLSDVYMKVFQHFSKNPGNDHPKKEPCHLGEEIQMDLGDCWYDATFKALTSDDQIGLAAHIEQSVDSEDLLKEDGSDCRKSPCEAGESVTISSLPTCGLDQANIEAEFLSYGHGNETANVVINQARQLQSGSARKHGLPCLVPKCVDMDFGKTDSDGDGCSAYNADIAGLCFDGTYEHSDLDHYWDTAEFDSIDMCCACGGGSTNLSIIGISHLPVNLSWDDFMEQEARNNCLRKAFTTEARRVCDQQYTWVSKAAYEAQLASFIRYCVLPDPDLCDNLQAQGMLPAWNITALDFVPLFFRTLGISSLDEMDPNEICRKSITAVCPTIFPHQFAHFQHQREGVCGKKTTDVVQGSMTVSYEGSQVYSDPGFGLMTWKFRLFCCSSCSFGVLPPSKSSA